MKKVFITGGFILLILITLTSCFHKETFQKKAGFQMLDFRGNYCYYLSQDYFIFMINGEHSVEHLDDNHDDVVIYEGTFRRFSKINQNYVAVENVYELDGKHFDEYALIFLPNTFHHLKDVKIQKVYDEPEFTKILAQKNLVIDKWEEA